MKFFLAALGLLFAVWAQAQAVTEKEFFTVCGEFEAAQYRVLKLDPPSPREPGKDKAVTRSQVVREFTRIWEKVRPKVRITPKEYRFDLAVLKRRNGAEDAALLAQLAGKGLIAPVGPLATGPKETMTAPQLGDAIGYFFSQVSYLTHKPSVKWTPSLMPVEGDG